MRKLRTILVEDEGASLRRMDVLVAKNNQLIKVGAASSGFEAIAIINKELPDLILLDIELKDMTAFDVISKLSPDLKCQLIFITAYRQHALNAFDVSATDYLLKPYSDERFAQAINKACERTRDVLLHDYLKELEKLKEEQKKIEITEGTKTHFILKKEIIWIQADGYYSLIHKVDGSKSIIRKTLKDMQSELPEGFERINRFAIINKSHITKTTKTISKEVLVLKRGFQLKKSNKYI